MKVIAVTGTGGGVGTTTVVAQLGAWMAAHNRPAVLFDFSPGNRLRLHHGMDWGDGSGLAPQILSGAPWQLAAYRSAAGVDFLPFGRLPGHESAARFESWLAARPAWFAARLQELELPEEATVICDCPGMASTLGQLPMASAHLALIVTTPDAASYASAQHCRELALAAGAGEALLVVNQFNPARLLDREIALLLGVDFPRHLVPVFIHQDEWVREALAWMQTVSAYAPASQAALDFEALATWLAARLAPPRESK